MAISTIPCKGGDLLWENPDPNTTSFSAQTIISNVDLTKYKYLELYVNERNLLRYGYKTIKTTVPSSGSASFVVSYASRAVIAERYFDLTPTSVACRGGSYFNAIGGDPIASDGFVIPYKIYGIK